MSINIFAARNAGGKTSKAEISQFLTTELGLQLRQKQDQSTIHAIAAPEDFIVKRTAITSSLLDDTSEIVKYYEALVQKYMEPDSKAGAKDGKGMGMPAQEAHALAFKAAQQMYQTEIQALDLVYPGYEKAFGQASIGHNATFAHASLADDALLKDAEMKKKYKAKYAAKKQKYKNKKTA